MPELVIFKNDCGKLEGFGEKGRRAWNKFIKRINELEIGETLQFSYRLPRSPQHHKFFFGRAADLFDRQERFEHFDHLMEFLKVGAGHVDFVPGLDGMLVALPRSIAWDRLEEQDFIEFTRAMNDFLWTPGAQAALWPHLDEHQRYAMVDQWFQGAR